MTVASWLNVAATVAAAVSALLLYWAGVKGPETWGEDTPRELAEARRRVILKWIGVPCVLVAAACQLAATMLST